MNVAAGEATGTAAQSPYRGIEPFRFIDRRIFFARDDETGKLLRYVTIYRGVLCYGDSGSGKSSVINAGLIPASLDEDFAPELLRVQPHRGAAVKVERIVTAEGSPPQYLPTIFTDDQQAERVFLSVDEFRERIRGAPQDRRPLLIFDQFEEFFTLFEAVPPGDAAAEARSTQDALLAAIAELMRDHVLRVKLLFAFREDFLAKLSRLFSLCPDLSDQYLRLTPPRVETLTRIIRGPFDEFPGRFGPELPVPLTEKLVAAFRERNQSGTVSLSEVQIVCQRLWQSADRDGLLDRQGIQGLLEDYLSDAVARFPADVRDAAVLVLTRMITDAGTRNVVSEYDVINDVKDDQKGVTEPVARQALQALERDARLIRREPRHDVYFYEIVSEFLVPWIMRQKNAREAQRKLLEERAAADARLAHEHRRTRRLLGWLAAAAVALVALVGLALSALKARNDAVQARVRASAQEEIAHGYQLALDAPARADHHLDLSALLAVEAAQRVGLGDARKALLDVFAISPYVTASLRGHTGAVRGLAFSPDGKTIASSGVDGAIYLWNAGSTLVEGALLGKDIVYSVRFSPDGQMLAGACADGTILLWNWTHDAAATPLKAHAGGAFDVDFSPDGKQLVSTGADGQVLLWDVAGRRRLQSLKGHRDEVYAVAFGDGGRTVVSGGKDKNVILWDVQSGDVRQRLPVEQQVFTVAISPDGKTVAAGHDDGVVRLWRVAPPQGHAQKVADLTGHARSVYRVAFSPDGEQLASVSRDRRVILWDVETGQRADDQLSGHREEMYAVAFGPDGTTLASGSADGTIVLWNLPIWQPKSGSRSESVHGKGMRAGPLTQILASAPSGFETLAFDPAGHMLFTGGRAGLFRRDLANNQPRQIGSTAVVESVAVTHDGTIVATGGCSVRGAQPGYCSTGEIQLLNAATGQPLRAALQAHRDWVSSLAFTTAGTLLASGGWDGNVMVWDVASGRARGSPIETGAAVNVVAFSGDDRLLAAGTGRAVFVWDAATLHEVARLTAEENGLVDSTELADVKALAFARDGTSLAIGARSPDVLWWDFGRKSVRRLDKHTKPLRALAFSPDGATLASGSDDHDVILWDAARKEAWGVPLSGWAAPVTALAFDESGNRLVSAGPDGPLLEWDLGLGSLRRRACQAAGRNLTPEEWQRFFRDEPYHMTCGEPLLAGASRHAALGARKDAEAGFTEAVRFANANGDHALANSVCWSGAVNGFATLVLPACERAVALAPMGEVGFTRDSRGVARALSGDLARAIEDFQAFVNWMGTGEEYKPYREKRTAWIAELRKGKNPFDAATLRQLKTE